MLLKTKKCLGTLVLTFICLFALTACQETTAPVAATVNGVNIYEDTITEHIQSSRMVSGLETDEAWTAKLAENDFTPESYREEAINYYIEQELIRQASEEEGIDVSEKLEEELQKAKEDYATEEEWVAAIESYGYAAESYRGVIETSLQLEQLREIAIPHPEPTEEQILEYLNENALQYNGARRSSHILFTAGDEALANEVLTKINSGELDFADAAKEYSKDPDSASEGGDMGWDALITFPPEYVEALAGLEKEQVSGLVTSEFGIHIIKLTDVFEVPDKITSPSQVPQGLSEMFEESFIRANEENDFLVWYEGLKEAATIVINDMPQDVPYNVEMS